MTPYNIEQTSTQFIKKLVVIIACVFVFVLVIAVTCFGEQPQDMTETKTRETTVPETIELLKNTTSMAEDIVTEEITTLEPETTVSETTVVGIPLPSETVPETEMQPAYLSLTEEERLIFATLIRLESGGCSYETKMAVASVVVNRMNMWNKTLRQVVFAKNQFSPAYLINRETGESYYNPSPDGSFKDCWKVVDDICANGPSIPSYILYFRTKHYHSWSTPYAKIGSMYFSYTEQHTSICKHCGELFAKTEIAEHQANCPQKS